ncbi:(2Fe-2S)-binding protein [Pseudonocardia nigra]|uniref:(2Fe-2S)-binding protein n=1 Tax=Pseudonocardia nigra TaxID=1921578 RepID=UPI001C5DC135|nr:(2Fe-2S)-binding protein [Pseudonocardia nigra]
MSDVRAVLADVAGLGPFFAVATDPAEAVDPTWRPMTELYADPRPLRDRIAHVGRVLGSDRRVAASIAFQGLAAVVVSAPFAAAVLHGVLPRLDAGRLHWRAAASGPLQLWCAEPDADGVPESDAAGDALAAAVSDEHLAPLVAAVRAQVPIAERLLWGSAASAVASAERLVAMQRPAAAGRAAAVAERLLGTGELAGTGELLPPVAPDRVWTFRRRSCCLYYRVPGGGLCGDCVLHNRRVPRR